MAYKRHRVRRPIELSEDSINSLVEQVVKGSPITVTEFGRSRLYILLSRALTDFEHATLSEPIDGANKRLDRIISAMMSIAQLRSDILRREFKDDGEQQQTKEARLVRTALLSAGARERPHGVIAANLSSTNAVLTLLDLAERIQSWKIPKMYSVNPEPYLKKILVGDTLPAIYRRVFEPGRRRIRSRARLILFIRLVLCAFGLGAPDDNTVTEYLKPSRRAG